MKRVLSLLMLTVALGFGSPTPAPAQKLVATLQPYVQWGAGRCTVELARADIIICIYLDKKGEVHPDSYRLPANVNFNYRCGDCTGQGDVNFYLQKAQIKTSGGKKMLYFKVLIDNNTVLKCHPMNPMNNQKFSAAPFEADFTVPWQDGYIVTRPGMWYHFVLNLEKQ